MAKSFIKAFLIEFQKLRGIISFAITVIHSNIIFMVVAIIITIIITNFFIIFLYYWIPHVIPLDFNTIILLIHLIFFVGNCLTSLEIFKIVINPDSYLYHHHNSYLYSPNSFLFRLDLKIFLIFMKIDFLIIVPTFVNWNRILKNLKIVIHTLMCIISSAILLLSVLLTKTTLTALFFLLWLIRLAVFILLLIVWSFTAMFLRSWTGMLVSMMSRVSFFLITSILLIASSFHLRVL